MTFLLFSFFRSVTHGSLVMCMSHKWRRSFLSPFLSPFLQWGVVKGSSILPFSPSPFCWRGLAQLEEGEYSFFPPSR